MEKNIFTKGNIIVFVIVLAVTIMAGVITAAFTLEKINIVAVSAMSGIIALMGIGGYCEASKKSIVEGPEAGIIAAIIGVILMLIIY